MSRIAASVIAAGIALAPFAAVAEPSPILAAVPGVRLFVTIYDTGAPCDFAASRLETDAKFTLNTANLDFVDRTNDVERDLPILEVVADSFRNGGSCLWLVRITASVKVRGGTALGSAYDGYSDIWTGGSYGIHPGQGLTAQVSDVMQTNIRQFINDVRESQKAFPAN